MSTFVWSSPWQVDGDRMRIPPMKNSLINLNLKVGHFLLENSYGWNQDMLGELFYPQDINIILKIKPIPSSQDFFSWNHTRSGEYTVKSGYWLAEREARKDVIALGEALPSLNGIKKMYMVSRYRTKDQNISLESC